MRDQIAQDFNEFDPQRRLTALDRGWSAFDERTGSTRKNFLRLLLAGENGSFQIGARRRVSEGEHAVVSAVNTVFIDNAIATVSLAPLRSKVLDARSAVNSATAPLIAARRVFLRSG